MSVILEYIFSMEAWLGSRLLQMRLSLSIKILLYFLSKSSIYADFPLFKMLFMRSRRCSGKSGFLPGLWLTLSILTRFLMCLVLMSSAIYVDRKVFLEWNLCKAIDMLRI